MKQALLVALTLYSGSILAQGKQSQKSRLVAEASAFLKKNQSACAIGAACLAVGTAAFVYSKGQVQEPNKKPKGTQPVQHPLINMRAKDERLNSFSDQDVLHLSFNQGPGEKFEDLNKGMLTTLKKALQQHFPKSFKGAALEYIKDFIPFVPSGQRVACSPLSEQTFLKKVALLKHKVAKLHIKNGTLCIPVTFTAKLVSRSSSVGGELHTLSMGISYLPGSEFECTEELTFDTGFYEFYLIEGEEKSIKDFDAALQNFKFEVQCTSIKGTATNTNEALFEATTERPSQ